MYYFTDFPTCSFLIYMDTWLPYNSWWFILFYFNYYCG